MNRPTALVVLLAAVGCSPLDYAYHPDERVDVFSQTRQRAIDLLLVIDNSCSMLDEQDHLAQSFEALIAALETGDTDWRVGTTTSEPALEQFRGRLSGGTDEIVLRGPNGGELDRVAYDDTTWTLTRGVALERCDGGAASDGWPPDGCEGPVPVAPDAGPRAPKGGELVVDAFLPWSTGDDTRCEWVALANRTPDTLDLTGVVLADDGRNAARLPDGTVVAPGASLVVGQSADRALNCDTPVDVVLTDPFSLAQGERWIDASTENAPEVFSELVAVGTGGFGLEMGMENALLTLSRPDNQSTSGGFLRPDADLALLFFSDEDDLSPDAVDDYIDAFRGLKGDAGYREPQRVRFGAAVGLEVDGGACGEGEAVYAERYLALVDRTDGDAWSICGDLSQVADQAGVTFSEQLLTFELSALPVLDTLVVDEYASEDDDSRIGPMIRDVDFVLEQPDGVTDAVRMVFPEDRVTPGSVVTVRYDALPDSATFELGGTP